MNFLVKVYSWENARLYGSEEPLRCGEKVVVSCEHFDEMGFVEKECLNCEAKEQILRKANKSDLAVHKKNETDKASYIEFCKSEVKRIALGMKIVDCGVSLDGKQIIFVFTSDGRVDFRELVRSLSVKYKKAVRMQQIGSRDEARKLGDCGVCGRKLCCVNFKSSIPSITTDMARVQQIAHRGTERISGACGRLMCCLVYEAQGYREMLIGMPELYSNINTKEGQGTVIEINAITQEIKVKLQSGKYLAIKKEDIK
jgi:cell fate regulator YaaT (PSP1 superfamily)